MSNVIFYKEYIEKKYRQLNKLSYESEKYARCCSIINRVIDWKLMDRHL